jgi:hypothetical protein
MKALEVGCCSYSIFVVVFFLRLIQFIAHFIKNHIELIKQ